LILESARHENEIMPDISWHDILSAPKINGSDDQAKPLSRPPTLNIEPKVNRRVSTIDLSDSDLKEILSEKRGVVEKPTKTKSLDDDNDDDLSDFLCVQFVSNLSSQLAEEILQSICTEMIDSDLISKLIAAELK
jgi:hypothetical protein